MVKRNYVFITEILNFIMLLSHPLLFRPIC